MDSSEVERANVQIQALAKACPRLRVILVGIRAKKAIIIREKTIGKVRCQRELCFTWVSPEGIYFGIFQFVREVPITVGNL